MTVLGDLAQATAPAAQQRWDDVVADLGSPAEVHLAELEVGYRVPGQLLDLANRLLPATGADVAPSRSVRSTPYPAAFVATAPAEVAAALTSVVDELRARHSSVAVISIDGQVTLHAGARARAGVSVLTAAEAKGLEFDGVVVVEPAEFLAAGRRGARLLYIALTRAVQELVVVHAEALPEAMVGPVRAAG
jgi:DNA helicase IV